MRLIANPRFGVGLDVDAAVEPGDIVRDGAAAATLFARCPKAHETPLIDAPTLAEAIGVEALWLKDERGRIGLGSFKALGAAHAIAKAAAARLDAGLATAPETALQGEVYVCASAGNHGLSMAAGARAFGARAVVHIAQSAPEAFAERLRAAGAEVARSGAVYEDAMAAAAEAAATNGWRLLSDSSWLGYAEPARDVMEGYLILGEEAARQAPATPTLVLVQAGVGGLAAAVVAVVRRVWGAGPELVVVEPEAAASVAKSASAGRPVVADGPVSAMGRLDCKEPSHLALSYLAREADAFALISEGEAADAVALLSRHGFETTPSGAAGVAALIGYVRAGAPSPTRAMAFLTEGPI